MTLLVLFVWSFAAATILPLSSEAPLALVVRTSGAWVVPVVVATLGNTLGACTTYGLARAAMTVAPAAGLGARRASTLLATYGAPALLLSWVPVIGDVLVLLAGAARMPSAVSSPPSSSAKPPATSSSRWPFTVCERAPRKRGRV